MHSAISVDTCVTIREACPVEYIVCGHYVEFSYGSLQKGFHFSFEPAALRKLLALGAEALAEMEARTTQQEQGERTGRSRRGRIGDGWGALGMNWLPLGSVWSALAA